MNQFYRNYDLLGKEEEALGLLEQAVKQGYGHRSWLAHDPDLTPLRDNPRFKELLKELD